MFKYGIFSDCWYLSTCWVGLDYLTAITSTITCVKFQDGGWINHADDGKAHVDALHVDDQIAQTHDSWEQESNRPDERRLFTDTNSFKLFSKKSCF